MDDRSFDRLARLLGEARDRRSGLKALVGGILGSGTLAALDDAADAKRRGRRNGTDDRRRGDDAEAEKKKKKKKTCKPACDSGYECVKAGRKRECVCASGITCGGACCAAGQTCENGACAGTPQPGACLAFGDPCKDTGKRCCAGLSCASGQDGSFPVACYRAKTAACERTAECAYGTACVDGVCLGNGGGGGVPTGAPCTSGANCDQPGATCTAYTGDDAPAGDFCTLPLRRVCTGDPDCTCYKCWYVNGGAQAGSRTGRRGRASTNTKACCHPPGDSCSTENDCCSGLKCTNNVCGGTMCVPEGGASADGACCAGLTVQNGVCTGDGGGGGGGGGGPVLGEACPTIDPGEECEDESTCTCVNTGCTTKTCLLLVEEECDTAVGAGAGQNNWCEPGTTCRQYDDTSNDDSYYCLRALSEICAWDSECASDKCAKAKPDDDEGVCVECITDPACEKMKGAPASCKRWSCDAGICKQVAATNTLCTLAGGGAGYCGTGDTPTCQATVTGCDVDATAGGTAAALTKALQDAPYKSAVAIAGDFTLTSEIQLYKLGCNDNMNPDEIFDPAKVDPVNGYVWTCPDGFAGTTESRVPWDITLVVCPGKTASISGGSTVTGTSNSDRSTWSWSGGSRIFHMFHTSLTIKGVNLKNGHAPSEPGGAFWLEYTDPPIGKPVLSLRDLEITQCKARTGGAIDAVYSVDLQNVTLTKNWAVAVAGAVYADLSQENYSYPNTALILDKVTMTDNVANNWTDTKDCANDYCNGAGIYISTNFVDNTGGTLTCRNQVTDAINNGPQQVTPTTGSPQGIGDCAVSVTLNKPNSYIDWTGCQCKTTATYA